MSIAPDNVLVDFAGVTGCIEEVELSWRMANDESQRTPATPERQRAADVAPRELDVLIALPKRARATIEHRIARELDV